MFSPEKWPHRLLLLQKWKSDSGPGPFFHKLLTPGPNPGTKKTHNPSGVESGTPDPVPPLGTVMLTTDCQKYICNTMISKNDCTAYWTTTRTGFILDTSALDEHYKFYTVTQQCFSPGVSKLRPADQIRPTKPFHLPCKDIFSIMKKS